jgi:hypothetical protein
MAARDEFLAHLLARKARDLTEDMHRRLGRNPDVADYQSAFEAILRDYDPRKAEASR